VAIGVRQTEDAKVLFQRTIDFVAIAVVSLGILMGVALTLVF
jgi:hypothetical protein